MSDKPPALGLYCHVPFCASTCDFCAFYQEKPRRDDLNRYLEAMGHEFALLPRDRVVETVFWGGGTPGLLTARDLGRLGRDMLGNLLRQPKEWTIEMAPSTVKADKLSVLKDMGVTRISMGVQSFDSELLASLGRLHNPRQIYKAWELIQKADFPQSNLDLMFAIPNQTLDQWKADIKEAAGLGADHISTYCLTFEEDTALYVKLAKGQIKIDETREIEFYENGWDLLAELGYRQYEISNFSRPGKECIHNINTWRMQEWIGCGPSAASQYAGERYQRPANLDAWVKGMQTDAPPKEDRICLDDSILFADSVIFGLRMNAGVDLARLRQQYPTVGRAGSFEEFVNKLKTERLAEIEAGSILKLTDKGRLLADAIGSQLLDPLATA